MLCGSYYLRMVEFKILKYLVFTINCEHFIHKLLCPKATNLLYTVVHIFPLCEIAQKIKITFCYKTETIFWTREVF